MKKRIHYTDKYLLNPVHPVSINLIGCGGTGSQVLSALARINCSLIALGHPGLYIRVYDPDCVSQANIGRQLFSPADILLNKAIVAVGRINMFFGFDWEARQKKFTRYNAETANITISCVDTVSARLEISEFFKLHPSGFDDKRPLYWLDFGNGKDTGQVILGTVDEIEQPDSDNETVSHLDTITEMFDLSVVNEEDSGPSCSLAEAIEKQDLFVNSTLANLGSDLIWKLISKGQLDMQGMFLNLSKMTVNPIKL